jgi:polyisoprenoid-binding protein YceI
MRKLFLALPLLLAVPVLAQVPTTPGAPVAARVKAGTYAVEPTHTLIQWSVNHFGFNDYFGILGEPTGSLTIDPKKLNATKVVIDIPIKNLVTANAKLSGHMAGGDFFETEKFPSAKFESTSVVATGMNAVVKGNLTIKGVTKPVTLNAKFSGAGVNPFNKKATVGFHATGSVMRSAWGMGYGLPMVGDKVDLKITAAFEM